MPQPCPIVLATRCQNRLARYKARHDKLCYVWHIMKAGVTAHPGRLLKRELTACGLSANRLALDIGVPSGRVTDAA
jgi:hypothetical protein